MTLTEAAVLAGVNRATAWRWVHERRLPARRRGLRTLEVSRLALEALRATIAPESARAARGPKDRPAGGRVGRAGALSCPVPRCGLRFADAAELAGHLVAIHVPSQGEAGRPPREGPPPRCQRRGCRTVARACGLCWKHYQAERRHEGRP